MRLIIVMNMDLPVSDIGMQLVCEWDTEKKDHESF